MKRTLIYFKIWLITSFVNGVVNGAFFYYQSKNSIPFKSVFILVFISSLFLALPTVLFLREAISSVMYRKLTNIKIFNVVLKTISKVSLVVSVILYLLFLKHSYKGFVIDFIISILIGFVSILSAVFLYRKSFNKLIIRNH